MRSACSVTAVEFAYAVTTTLYRFPRKGGEPGKGFHDFAVDDECVYYAQEQYMRPGIQF